MHPEPVSTRAKVLCLSFGLQWILRSMWGLWPLPVAHTWRHVGPTPRLQAGEESVPGMQTLEFFYAEFSLLLSLPVGCWEGASTAKQELSPENALGLLLLGCIC